MLPTAREISTCARYLEYATAAMSARSKSSTQVTYIHTNMQNG